MFVFLHSFTHPLHLSSTLDEGAYEPTFLKGDPQYCRGAIKRQAANRVLPQRAPRRRRLRSWFAERTANEGHSPAPFEGSSSGPDMNGQPAPSLTRGSAYDGRQRLLGDRKPLTPEADSYPETAPRRFSYGLTPNSEPPSLDRLNPSANDTGRNNSPTCSLGFLHGPTVYEITAHPPRPLILLVAHVNVTRARGGARITTVHREK